MFNIHEQKVENIENAGMRVNNCKFAKDSPSQLRYVQLCLSVKVNNARENHWKPLFALISVRILLKQLDYSLSISMRR